MKRKPSLSIVWFPDCTLWEVDFLRLLTQGLSQYGEVELIRVPAGNEPRSEKWGDKVWLVAHDWNNALHQVRKQIKGREVWVSVLSLPTEKGSLFTLLWRRLMPSFPASIQLITHSPINFRFFREMEGWRNDRLTFHPFGCVPQKQPPKPVAIAEQKLVVGTFSRLLPESNLNYILNVAHYVVQQRPDVIFRILGTGPLYGHLIQSVRDLGLESRVEVVETEFSSFLSSVDILLYPPTRNDHFLPLFGAAEFACPVVSVNLPGIESYLHDGKTGFIVQQFETKSMAELVIRLIDHEPLRTAIGLEFQKQMISRFSLDAVTSEYAEPLFGTRSKVRSIKAA